MSIKIIPIVDHESYDVNGNTVFLDGLGNWYCKAELSQRESNAFHNYKNAIIENKDIKKHTTSTYKGS
ncbi:hypothetical protein [Flavobacterium sp.]|uniref:hypothetical protein n=1 Tax=Flavobacterium sp. TaxID=239 RepID=UPI00375033F9